MPASRADPSGYRQNGVTLKLAFLGRNNFGWKTLLLSLLLVGSELAHPTSSTPITFDSIKFWAGSGAKRAAMVIQWNDAGTPTSLLWGYRWDGVATGIDMVQAIAGSTTSREDGQSVFLKVAAGADPRLALSLINYSFGSAVEALVFNDRQIVRTQNDWSTGYWEYSVFGGTIIYDLYSDTWDYLGQATYDQEGTTTYSGVNWFFSPIGISERILVDGSWDAFSFAPNFTSIPVVEPSPALPPPPTAKSIRLKSSTELEIIFTTTPNIAYQLESKEDLLALGWSFQGSSFSAISAETKFIVPIQSNNPKKFFRLRQLP